MWEIINHAAVVITHSFWNTQSSSYRFPGESQLRGFATLSNSYEIILDMNHRHLYRIMSWSLAELQWLVRKYMELELSWCLNTLIFYLNEPEPHMQVCVRSGCFTSHPTPCLFSGKAVEDIPSLWALHPSERLRRCCWLLYSDQLNSGCCGYMGVNKQIEDLFLWLSLN